MGNPRHRQNLSLRHVAPPLPVKPVMSPVDAPFTKTLAGRCSRQRHPSVARGEGAVRRAPIPPIHQHLPPRREPPSPDTAPGGGIRHGLCSAESRAKRYAQIWRTPKEETMALISRVYDILDDEVKRPRERKLLSAQEDLIIACNVYQPGARNEFHYHKGTSQSFLVMKGTLTLRTMSEEGGEVEEYQLEEGQCALIPGGQYYQLHNETDDVCLLYQVKKPGDQIVILGKGQLTNKDYFTEKRQQEHVL
ncbi:MAG: cupin domain-containing protein [Alphaproteobacteria bacterium]|nr:MAG: cupin domain-containing protein [Alphaproteobacteria bacterium]